MTLKEQPKPAPSEKLSLSNKASTHQYADFYGPKYWLTWLGLGSLWLIARLPLPVQFMLGRLIGNMARVALPKRRHIAEVNIKLCFPHLNEKEQQRLVKRTLESNAIGFFEAATSWFSGSGRFRTITKAHGLEHLRKAQQAGKGVILLGGHYTTLDLGGCLFNLYAKASAMQRDHDNPLFNLAMTRSRLQFVDELLSKDDLRGILRLMRGGKTIWYATDQDYGSRSSVFAPFFDIPTATLTTTARIAKKTGAAVIPFSHFRNYAGGYDVYFGAPLENYPCGDDVKDAATTNKVIEDAIRLYPDQYLWIHRRFKTEPDGSKHHRYGGKKVNPNSSASPGIHFFAARKIQRNYFKALANQLSNSQVIWYKAAFMPTLSLKIPTAALKPVIADHILEKRNKRSWSDAGWAAFAKLKLIEACWLYACYYNAFKGLKGKLVMWNGLKYRQRIAVIAAKNQGLKVVYMENGLIPGMTTLDGKGINFRNSMPGEASGYPPVQTKTRLRLPVTATDTTSAHSEPTLPENYWFLPLQVDTDSQIILFSPWIENMRNLLAVIEKLDESLLQAGTPSPAIIIKPHPAGASQFEDVQAKFANHPRLHFAPEVSTPALIQNASAVLTVNSTVGIEALIAAKPVLVMGQAFYNIPGLTLSGQDEESLLTSAQSLISGWQPDLDLCNRFLVALENYQLPGDWRKPTPEHYQAVCSRLESL